jgi:hypothetical protein
MRHDALPAFAWMLALNGQNIGFFKRVNFPTDTSMTLEFGIGMEMALYNWMSEALNGCRRRLPGTLLTLDTALHPVYCDAWDSGWIKEIVLPSPDAARSGAFPLFRLSLQISHLREVPVPQPTGGKTSQPAYKGQIQTPVRALHVPISQVAGGGSTRKDPLPFFCFKLQVDGLPDAHFVKKLSTLKLTPGMMFQLVITIAESAAADFRAWKQSGGQRDVTIQYLNTALRTFFTLKCSGTSIDQIHPAAPLSPTGATEVTLRVMRVSFQFS